MVKRWGHQSYILRLFEEMRNMARFVDSGLTRLVAAIGKSPGT